MAIQKRFPGSPFLYDSTSGDIVGVSDPDGSQLLFARIPHVGAFHSESTQTASLNTATALTFPVTDISKGITVVSNSRLTVTRTAIYNIQFSAQFRNSAGQEGEADIWFRINGDDVAASNTRITIPKTHAGGDGYLVAAWNIFLSMNAGQYAQIMWSTPSNDISIYTASGLTSPTRPIIPSVIATINEVDGSYE